MITSELQAIIAAEVSKQIRASRMNDGAAELRVDPFNIPFKNTAGETIPPYSVMRPDDDISAVADSGGNWFLKMKKVDDTFRRRYYINGPFAIPANGYGMCSDGSLPTLARWNGTAPDILGGVGVRSGQWNIEDDSIGNFTFLGLFGEITGTYAYELCLLTQQDCNKLIVRGAEAITGGTFGDANVCRSASCVETTVGPIEIRDRQFGFGVEYPDDTLYGVSWVNGAWFIDWFDECPA